MYICTCNIIVGKTDTYGYHIVVMYVLVCIIVHVHVHVHVHTKNPLLLVQISYLKKKPCAFSHEKLLSRF